MAVQGLGRTETCMTHHDRPAAARCANCHKPVCSNCVVTTADGKFCSHECAKKTSDYRARAKTMTPRGGGLAKLVKAAIWLVIILAALGAANKYAFKNKMPVIGNMLNKLPFFGTTASGGAGATTTNPTAYGE